MNIVDKQLFPVLAFGRNLWNFKKTSVVRTVDVRKGLGMKQRESLSERFPDRFSEAVAKIKRQQLRFLERATLSCNKIVGLFA